MQKDGERVSWPVKELGHVESAPLSLKHDPTGRFIAAVGDGEYTIYTALAWRNKSYGSGLDFAWGQSGGYYAVRTEATRVALYRNFKETGQIVVRGFVPTALAGGALVCVQGPEELVFYDWEGRYVQRIDVAAKNVIWAENGERLAVTTENAFFVLKYHAADVAEKFASGEDVEGGIEEAFEVENEVSEPVRSGIWVGDCFIYVNEGSGKLCYCVGGQVFTVALLDRPMYVLGYIPRHSRVYLMDKAQVVVSYSVQLAVINYQTAILRGDAMAATELLPQIPHDQLTRVAKFLQAQGFLEEALAVSTDDDHRFELSIQLGLLDTAIEIVERLSSASSPELHKWHLLADAALRAANFDLAARSMDKAGDLAGLLLLYSAQGNAAAISELAGRARAAGANNIAFACYYMLRRVPDCLALLCDTGRFAEAAFMARTFAPSHVPRLVALWRQDLASKGFEKAAEALADPEAYPNLFPGFAEALEAEKYLTEEYAKPVPAAELEKFAGWLDRDILQELRNKDAKAVEAVTTTTEKETEGESGEEQKSGAKDEAGEAPKDD